MPMSQADQQKALVWLNGKGLGKCKECGGQVSIQDELVCMPIFDKYTKAVNASTFIIFVMGLCKSCSTTVFFNAEPIGIL
jgi:hypothetical protein